MGKNGFGLYIGTDRAFVFKEWGLKEQWNSLRQSTASRDIRNTFIPNIKHTA